MTDEEMKKMQPAYYAIELRKMVARDMIPQYQHIKTTTRYKKEAQYQCALDMSMKIDFTCLLVESMHHDCHRRVLT